MKISLHKNISFSKKQIFLFLWSLTIFFQISGQSASTPVQHKVTGALGWEELPNTHLQDVCPPNNYGGQTYDFNYYCNEVIRAWSGGIADVTRNRLIMWGGGHSDYGGNELYSLNLNSTPATVTRLNDPGPLANYFNCTDSLTDNTPNSRHTYNGLTYIEHADRMYALGSGVYCGIGGVNPSATWILDVNNLQWQKMDPVNGTSIGSPLVVNTVYDSSTKTVLIQRGSFLFRYTYETNTYNLLSSNASAPFSSTMVLDPKRKLLLFIGTEYNDGLPHVKVIDIAPGSNYDLQDWSAQVIGCDSLAVAYYPGLAYDPILDKIVGWPNHGNTVYVFDPDTKTCIAQTFPNGPLQTTYASTMGTFGRFRYFPDLNAYAVVNGVDNNAFLLRLTQTTTGIQTASDTQLSISISYDYNSIDLLFENIQEKDIAIYDMTGKLIMKQERMASPKISFAKSSFTPGIYVARVKTGDFFVSKKFVVQY